MYSQRIEGLTQEEDKMGMKDIDEPLGKFNLVKKMPEHIPFLS